MNKIGVAFRSSLTPDQVREKYIGPLREALRDEQIGIYTNYLRQVDPQHETEESEHLIIFEVKEFKAALRLLRLELQQIGMPAEVQFQNLNPSQPGY